MSKIVTALVFFLAALALGFFYAIPAWSRFGALGDDIAQLEQASGEFDQLIANRDNLLNLINGITKDNLARLDQIFPQGAHASEFLVSVEALTTQNTMALRRIDLVSPSENGQSAQNAKSASGSASQPRPTTTTAAQAAGSGSAGREKKMSGARQELPFSIQIAGSYENFKRFLIDAERNLRLIDIDEVSFTSTGKRDDSTEYTLKAKTYYQ
jgi:Tfp pilus assembly protein PilO